MKFLFTMVTLMGLTISQAVFAACDEREKIVRFSIETAIDGHPKGEAAKAIAKRMDEEMDGVLCLQIFPRSQLFDDRQAMKELLLGNVELVAPSLAKLEAYTKKYRIYEFPFLFSNMESVNKFTNSDKGQELLGTIENKGYVGLSYIHNGLKNFSASKPLVTPSDAKGLTFRVQTSDVGKAMIDAIGGTALKLAFKDVRFALMTRTVDGQENTWSNIFTRKFFEHQDGVTETNHQLLVYITFTSKKWLDTLPREVRDQFVRIVQEESAKANSAAAEKNAVAKQNIIKAGSTIRTLSPAQRSQWISAMKPVWNKFVGDVGQDTLDAAIASNK